ncbi:MAG TPA: FecR domain-containing protein [bacterium]|nr:FecR domain-containing protein [bacterium]HOL47904.1 FecR domain-containing protein [bacterium]HPQ19219.1 FecR domain-containing protein [bacterium]
MCKKIYIIFLLLIPYLLFADEIIEPKVDYVVGIAYLLPPQEENWLELKEGMIVKQGSQIRTGKESIVDLKFDEKTFIRISENTITTLEKAIAGEQVNKKLFFSKSQPMKKISLKMEKGNILSKVGKLSSQSEFTIKTPTAVCGVRGTLFNTSHTAQTTSVKVMNGIVAVSNISMPHIQTFVMPGQTTNVSIGKTPEPPRQMSQSEIRELKGLIEGSQTSIAPVKEQEAPAPAQPSQPAEQTEKPEIKSEITPEVKSEVKSEIAPSVAPTPKTEPIRPPDTLLNTTTKTIVETVVTTTTKPILEKSKLKINVNFR